MSPEKRSEAQAHAKTKTQEICRNLGQLAQNNGIRQVDLAEYIGYAQGNLSRLFKGTHTPGLDAVLYILNAINDLTGTAYSLKDIDVPASPQTPNDNPFF
jgi:transcriptional regulator with XRE-family HTH domain